MSILKTTNSGSKSIHVTSEQTIINEIAKLGYTFNPTLRCWMSNLQNMPDLVLREYFNYQSSIYEISVYYEISRRNLITYTIISMSDLFNFIKDLKPICQS